MWIVHVTRLVVSNWRTWLRVIPLALVVVALTVSSGITNARQLSDEQKNIASYGSTSGLFSLQEDVPPGTPVPIPRNNTLQASAPFPQLYSNINLVQYDDVAYQEMPMAGSATQGRYRLTSGRWPARFWPPVLLALMMDRGCLPRQVISTSRSPAMSKPSTIGLRPWFLRLQAHGSHGGFPAMTLDVPVSGAMGKLGSPPRSPVTYAVSSPRP